MTLDDLRKQIDNGTLHITPSVNTIETGTLTKYDGTKVPYHINHGWDLISSNQCDKEWGYFRYKLYEDIEKAKYSDEEEATILDSIQVEDEHWDWFAKSIHYRSIDYEWFYLYAEGKPQGVCVFYHPKESKLDVGNIFYIEYLATASWNRDNLIHNKLYKGIGTILVKKAISYAVNILHLQHGFSLHSLPQACQYYDNLGMQRFLAEDKPPLIYFEMPKATSISLLGAI